MKAIDRAWYRGKEDRTNQWVVGYLTYNDFTGRYYIKQKDTSHVVDPKTVGQWTGFKDKNGDKIFEGMHVFHISFPLDIQKVVFNNGFFMVGNIHLSKYHHSIVQIHDNPELLEE